MATLAICKRCGADIRRKPHATIQKFCSKDCYDTWWSEQRSTRITRGEWALKRYGPVNRAELTEPQKAWLAAMIDGEGTIGVYRTKRPGNKSGYRYQAVCSFCNTNRALLERFAELSETTIVSKKANGVRAKPLYTTTIKGRFIRSFIEQVYPYLVAKVRQANVVLDFVRALEGAPCRTSSYHEIFDTYYQQIRALNRKGAIEGASG